MFKQLNGIFCSHRRRLQLLTTAKNGHELHVRQFRCRQVRISPLISCAHKRAKPPVTWGAVAILVSIERGIHSLLIERPSANRASVNVGWPQLPGSRCAAHGRHARHRARRRNGKRPRRSQFNRVTRREHLRRYGRLLHSVHTIGTMLP